jgi:hypothetical protein
MLGAVDWLPTLAGMVGASNLVPKDRPIDGVDASAFMLGKSNATGRDSYMFFGPDGELMSVKWEIYKVILRYSEGIDKPIVKPAASVVLRPKQRSPRGLEPLQQEDGHRLDGRPGFSEGYEIRDELEGVPKHQARRGVQGIP